MEKHWQFQPGNQMSRKMTPEENIELFKEMYALARKGWYLENEEDEQSRVNVYSIEAIFTFFEIPKSTFYYKCDHCKICQGYQEMMLDTLVARVDRGAIDGELSATPAIFRMKNLGQIDEATVNQNHSGAITEHKVTFSRFKGKK